MSLDAHVVRALGTFSLDVELHARQGEVMALLGPNGAGKSTLLRCLAGLLALDAGQITLDGQCLDAPDIDRFVSPEQRPVSMVFQSYLLFPNLTALGERRVRATSARRRESTGPLGRRGLARACGSH